jgi:hypothetical protein
MAKQGWPAAVMVLILFLLPAAVFAELTDDTSLYYSVTTSAEFKELANKPSFAPVRYTNNDRLEDIKVGLVEAIPFGFIISMFYIGGKAMLEQKTFSPKFESLDKYQSVYYPVIGTFAAVTTFVNMTFYYKYGSDTTKHDEGDGDGKKTAQKKQN